MDAAMAQQQHEHHEQQLVINSFNLIRSSVQDLHSFHFNFRNGSTKILRPIGRLHYHLPAKTSSQNYNYTPNYNINIMHQTLSDLPSSSTGNTATTRESRQSTHLLRLTNSLGKTLGQRLRLFSSQLSCKHGDHNPFESFVNVVTSMPFIFIGLQSPRNTMRNKVYANCLVGVGATSSLYHTSRGNARTLLRWGDYAMISTSAICLTRALRKEKMDTLMLASAILLPFRPSLVTFVHTGITEVTFLQRAKSNPSLRSVHRIHAASGILGCGLYIADGIFPDKPFIHAAWHLAAAISVATYTKLLS